ncbi:MAG: thioredoxin fold domain-containing protein [Kiritimatiellaeota bacterium]|nr:thioredoxin fold domain-containing protein [Kiritimatiellota bacterium]
MSQECRTRPCLAGRLPIRSEIWGVRAARSYCIAAILAGFAGIFSCPSADGREKAVTVEVVLLQPPAARQPLVAAVRFHIPKGLHVYRGKDRFFRIDERSSQNLGPARIVLPPSKTISDAVAGKPDATVEVFAGEVEIRIERQPTGKDGEPWSYQGVVGFQACSDNTCFMPQEVPFALSGIIGRSNAEPEPLAASSAAPAGSGKEDWARAVKGFQVMGRTTGYLRKAAFLAFLDRAESGRAAGTRSPLLARLQGHGMVWMLLIILVWGLALNLTPCVLPMVPVNLAIIGAGARAGSRTRGLLLGTVYGLAIAAVYGLLGLLVVLTGSTFGAINASPWFNLGIAALFVVLALAMFDVFLIDFSRIGAGLGAGGKSGTVGLALFMGGVSALLAGACVAPAVIAVLLFSAKLYADGIVIGLALPFVLGLGMALPWPFAGAGIALLPKPGRWMTYVRNGLGVLILLLAGYYAWTGIQLLTPHPAHETTVGAAGAPDDSSGGWLTSLDEALLASRTTGRPLFVDFWATWCKNCRAMEATTFRAPEVRDRLAAYIRLKFQAEQPKDPETRAVLQYFKVQGLPTYLLLKPPPGPVSRP